MLKSKNYINVVVASKHPSIQWLNIEEATEHAKKGIDEWSFVSTSKKGEPDLVLASAGDVPTLEAIAATTIMHKFLPNLKIKYINVVDLMRLVSNDNHPHGLTDTEYNKLFTKNKPIIFAFHGYPSLIHELTYKRKNQNMHVHGYIEEGTITTPFDMRVQNKLDRYHLILDALNYIPNKSKNAKKLQAYCLEMLDKHNKTIVKDGIDIEEVTNWSLD
jgi:xylulose-5-phosphate/fructose-6-phosphate phosphoketolase